MTRIIQTDINLYKFGYEHFICDSLVNKIPEHKLIEVNYHGEDDKDLIKNGIIYGSDIYDQGLFDLPTQYYKFPMVSMVDKFIDISDLEVDPEVKKQCRFIKVENTKSRNKTFNNIILELQLNGYPKFNILTKKEAVNVEFYKSK